MGQVGLGSFSDGYHTFDELYHHRAILFAVICANYKELAWKSKLHDTGDMYDGMFIVGIQTPQGQATYHYDIEPYWEIFNVKEVEKAPKWDGHTPDAAIERIYSLIKPSKVMVGIFSHEKNKVVNIIDNYIDTYLPKNDQVINKSMTRVELTNTIVEWAKDNNRGKRYDIALIDLDLSVRQAEDIKLYCKNTIYF